MAILKKLISLGIRISFIVDDRSYIPIRDENGDVLGFLNRMIILMQR
jgi:hypothetical protein